MKTINKNTNKQELSGLGGCGCFCAICLLFPLVAILLIGATTSFSSSLWEKILLGILALVFSALGIWLLIKDFED